MLERTGRREHALAALERAVTLEPDNWRHQVRLALGSWGETRLRAARRALAQCPQLPLAHWLAATVLVARNALDHAERNVDRGLAVAAVESPEATPYSMVALHWLKGLLRNAAGAADDAMASFDQELALEARGHLYAREAAANTWYAKGACCLVAGDRDGAGAAFREAVARVPRHPMAHAGLAILNDQPVPAASDTDTPEPVDLAMARPHDWCTPTASPKRFPSCVPRLPPRRQGMADGSCPWSRSLACGTLATPGHRRLPCCTCGRVDSLDQLAKSGAAGARCDMVKAPSRIKA